MICLTAHTGTQNAHCRVVSAGCAESVVNGAARWKGETMILLLVILIILLAASAPAWPYSRGWGYYPSGGLGLVVIILIVLMLMGHI
jgi:hypothetical protein